MPTVNYKDDYEFLSRHADIIQLQSTDGAQRLVVVPAFQGRIMTSTLDGDDGISYGWLNRDFISVQPTEDPIFNNYGGEDRFWLGPEAGQFSLFFDNGDPFDLDHWRVSKGFGSGGFEVTSQGDNSIAMTTQFKSFNYSGTVFDCAVKRTINLLDRDKALKDLGVCVCGCVKMIAFESVNTLVNSGPEDWTREKGLVSIWTLGMFKGLENGKVVIPFDNADDPKLGPKYINDYFNAPPADRFKECDGFVWFKCDAIFRAKIGIRSTRAKNVFASFDFANNQLTIVKYTLPKNASALPYVNPAWGIQDNPFEGDSINSYNDGGTDNGEPAFFEMETSSPACELKAGQSQTHTHRTMHFSGSFDALNEISKTVLGADLETIK